MNKSDESYLKCPLISCCIFYYGQQSNPTRIFHTTAFVYEASNDTPPNRKIMVHNFAIVI